MLSYCSAFWCIEPWFSRMQRKLEKYICVLLSFIEFYLKIFFRSSIFNICYLIPWCFFLTKTETFSPCTSFEKILFSIFLLLPFCDWFNWSHLHKSNHKRNSGKSVQSTRPDAAAVAAAADISIFTYIFTYTSTFCGGVMVKALDCGIVVRKFELQSSYYVHFQTNTLGKGMDPLIPPAIGWIVPLLSFWKDGFGIK